MVGQRRRPRSSRRTTACRPIGRSRCRTIRTLRPTCRRFTTRTRYRAVRTTTPIPRGTTRKRSEGSMNIARVLPLVVLAAVSLCATGQNQNAARPAAAAPPSFATVKPPEKLAGKLERITVHGDSLVGNLSGDSPDRLVSVYLPPSYAAQPQRRYPVLYLLHGFTDSDANWFGFSGAHFVNVPGATDRASAAGARELIIVMPNAFTKFAGSMYS